MTITTVMGEMTLSEYSTLIDVLAKKPLLTVKEASVLFNIGFNRIYKLLNGPAADAKVSIGRDNKKIRVSRVKFEEFLVEGRQA